LDTLGLRFGGTLPKHNYIAHRRLLLRGMTLFPFLLWPRLALPRSRLRSVRLVPQEDLRVYLELDSMPVESRVFMLDNPARLVVDLADCELDSAQPPMQFAQGTIEQVRFGVQADRHLRVVFDLRAPVTPSYEIVERANGHRLIINLGVPDSPLNSSTGRILESKIEDVRDLIVAIDAGHGGKDPGANGQQNTREKDITLDVAIRLHKRLSKEPGIKPLLVRKSDVYMGLRERTQFARDNNADLFVSIHADAVPRLDARGSSVYALSLKGASSETAQWLADNEERGDLFGDVDLDGHSKDVQQTLIELAQYSTLESSIELGAHLLVELDQIGPLHKQTVELANFAVLKSPDIPSVLVETAFISNPSEERKLNNKRFREKLARSLQAGIMNYLRYKAPEGTLLATHRNKASG